MQRVAGASRARHPILGSRFGGKVVKAAIAVLSLSMLAALPHQAAAWWDGHKAVALIAEHHLTPKARKQVEALLAADTDELTKHDIANAASSTNVRLAALLNKRSPHLRPLTKKCSACPNTWTDSSLGSVIGVW